MIKLLKDTAQTVPRGNLLGLDVGKKTIGLALGNVEQGVATPLETIKRSKFTQDMNALKHVIEAYDVEGFIIGYPVNMDGSEGPRAQSIRDFAIEMERHLKTSSLQGPGSSGLTDEGRGLRRDDDGGGVWIVLMDERLSTVSADNIVDDLVEKRKTKANAKASGLIDKLAAQVILQGALDYIGRRLSVDGYRF